tara:strand:+ start:272 stop:838 length:567 start_codon:yes stop_codon:yes gene_type:complete
MIKIGITGSLSSGKSTVVKFMSRNKYPVFSADKTVKSLYKKKIFKEKVKKKFSLKNTKNLKEKIKNLIQKDKKILKQLELIIHPLVRKEMKFFMKLKRGKKIKLLEIPLLIESKLMKYFDIVIFVCAKKNIRIKRYTSAGGNKKIFTVLEKRQASTRIKIKKSDFVIYNNKSLKNLKKKVNFFIKKYE